MTVLLLVTWAVGRVPTSHANACLIANSSPNQGLALKYQRFATFFQVTLGSAKLFCSCGVVVVVVVVVAASITVGRTL